MSRVLYVEDEPFLAKIVKETLEGQGYQVTHVDDGGVAVDTYTATQYDLCVLDVMLPHINGYDIAREIRMKDAQVPIIFLTAKDQTEDVIKGFRSGGNDYLRKPFSIEELIARIENLINIASSSKANDSGVDGTMLSSNTTYFADRLELVIYSRVIKLSHKESLILQLLSDNSSSVLPRRDLLMKVWGDDSFFNSRTLDVYISKLRGHLKADPQISILTLKGVGYRFVVE